MTPGGLGEHPCTGNDFMETAMITHSEFWEGHPKHHQRIAVWRRGVTENSQLP
jgi:hypothetical protein